MKGFSIRTLVAVTAFFFGLIAVGFYIFTTSELPQTVSAQTKIESNKLPKYEFEKPSSSTIKDEVKSDNPLDKVWQKTNKINYNGYTITKNCQNKSGEYYGNENCKLKLFKGKKLLVNFDSERSIWLEFGFFNFLGGRGKQLIIYKYSGGAHCCYNYSIYDLKATFITLYDSTKFDEIGNQMVPVDLDNDGVFELEQSVMTFDSFHTSYSSSVFPPAVFAFNKNFNRFEFANKKFANYILDKKNKYVNWLETTYGKDDPNYKQGILNLTFAYLVYAGKEKEAWNYFDQNYHFDDKETFRTEIKKRFAKDVNYSSLYGK
jgi:hypothetical protein